MFPYHCMRCKIYAPDTSTHFECPNPNTMHFDYSICKTFLQRFVTSLQTCTNTHEGLLAYYFTTQFLILCTNEYGGYGLWLFKVLYELQLYYNYMWFINCLQFQLNCNRNYFCNFSCNINGGVCWKWRSLGKTENGKSNCIYICYVF